MRLTVIGLHDLFMSQAEHICVSVFWCVNDWKINFWGEVKVKLCLCSSKYCANHFHKVEVIGQLHTSAAYSQGQGHHYPLNNRLEKSVPFGILK